jgi:hypothetical protein
MAQHPGPGASDLARCTIVVATLACIASCAGPKNDGPHIGVRDMWRRFEALPNERSMAISGNPDAHWVGAAVGDFATQYEADVAALAQCKRRRTIARLQARCRIYARGDEVVWDPFERDPDPAEPDATD